MSYIAGELENALYSLSRVVKLAPNTPMADEAKRYLEVMKGVVGEQSKNAHPLGPVKAADVEVLCVRDLMPTEPSVCAPSIPGILSAQMEFNPRSDGTAPADSTGKPGGETAQDLSGEMQWTYIIQVGSFLTRENADRMQTRLEQQGYNTIVKACNHKVLGSLFVVQLKPLRDGSKAETIMVGLNTERQVTPVLIKVPGP